MGLSDEYIKKIKAYITDPVRVNAHSIHLQPDINNINELFLNCNTQDLEGHEKTEVEKKIRLYAAQVQMETYFQQENGSGELLNLYKNREPNDGFDAEAIKPFWVNFARGGPHEWTGLTENELFEHIEKNSSTFMKTRLDEVVSASV